MNFNKYIYGQLFCMEEAGDGKGAGGGNTPSAPTKEEFAALQIQYVDLAKKLEAFSKPPEDKKDLSDAARKQREAEEAKAGDSKALESALTFNIKLADFIKTNTSLLPKDVEGVFKAAEKENFANAIEKASAIKSGIVKEFFAVQENIDLLTEKQKAALAEYFKFTPAAKLEKAQSIYDDIFEPAFESLKRVKKAEQVALSRNGGGTQNDDLIEKRITRANKHFLREKSQ